MSLGLAVIATGERSRSVFTGCGSDVVLGVAVPALFGCRRLVATVCGGTVGDVSSDDIFRSMEGSSMPVNATVTEHSVRPWSTSSRAAGNALPTSVDRGSRTASWERGSPRAAMASGAWCSRGKVGAGALPEKRNGGRGGKACGVFSSSGIAR